MRDKLKNLLSLFLGRWTGIESQTWLVEGGSRKRVATRGHYNHLLETYFSDHPGVFWRDGLPLPEIPPWVLAAEGRP